jgi:hypothetical protein
MRSFDLDVVPGHGSWLIKLESRIMSGAATRDGAERIARHAAETLRLSGSEVRLRVWGRAGGVISDELIAAEAAVAA